MFSALFLIASLFHSKTNLKTYYEQVKKFFNPPNTQSLSEESLNEKLKTFMYVLPFHLVQYANTQILNLCHG